MIPRIRWVAPESHVRAELPVSEIVGSGHLTRSIYGQRFEAAVRKICGRNAIAVNSGTSAVWAGLRVFQDVRPGSVVVPAFGFPATPRMAALAGADIVVVDSAQDSPMIDIELAATAIDASTSTVAVTDYLDSVVDCVALRSSLPDSVGILEDSAGSFLSRQNGQLAGRGGDIATISMHASKVVCASEGGILLSDEPNLVDRLKALRANGLRETVYYSTMSQMGMNIVMPEVCAAIGIESIASVADRIETRRRVRHWYTERLGELRNSELIGRLTADEDTTRFGPLSITVENRDAMLRVLRLNGIEARVCWGQLASEDPVLRGRIRVVGDLRRARWWRDHIVNLPVHEAMKQDDVDVVCEALRRGAEALSATSGVTSRLA